MSSDMSIHSVTSSTLHSAMTTETSENRARSSLSRPNESVASSIEIQSMKDLNEAQMHGENVQISDQQVIRMIEKANKALQLRSTAFEFAVHKQTKQIMVKVFDKDSGEVIREIPPQKVLDMVAKMWELAGLLIDERL
jgi:flagellar protein FlaG